MRLRLPAAYQDLILNTRGLLAYWPCDDSGNVARDLKGGGGNGTFTGTVGRVGRSAMGGRDATSSFAFTGVASSYVSGTGTTLKTLTSDDWSIMAWVFMPTTVTANASFVFGYGTETDTAGVKNSIIRFTSAILGWGFGVPAQTLTGVDFDVGKPQMIAFTKTGSTTQVTKNGVSIGTATPTLANTSQTWSIGKAQGAFVTAALTANIGHFAAFDRGLPATELRHLYVEGSL